MNLLCRKLLTLVAALSQSGATATMVLQDADSLLVASVGDSRAILAGEHLQLDASTRG